METCTPASAPFATGNASIAPSALNRYFECDDVDIHARYMDGWAVQLDQLSPGRFHGTLHEINLDGMQLLREKVNRALLKRGTTTGCTLSFSVPLETAGAGYCGGRQLKDKALLVSNGTSLPELRTPEQHDVAVLSVPGDAIASLASLDDPESTGLSSGTACMISLSDRHYEGLKAFLVASFDTAAAEPEALAYPQARKALHDAVLLELEKIATAEHPLVRLEPSARRRIVDQVRELVISRPDTPFTVLDICRTVGTSRRKLQYCFEDILGTHPAYYLRVLRLNAVRRELRRQAPGTGSVGDTAFRWGFWHLSRFSTHYRELFGELPSETLKRAPQ
jgi:AraC family transcriptional regulator, ethanolamine operon transcriptional activator